MRAPSGTDPVETLVAEVRRGAIPSAEQSSAVLELLAVWLGRRGLSQEDREEVCADALMRLVEMVQTGRMDPARPAGAWLRVVADHLAIDAIRKRQRRAGITFDERIHARASDDDRLAAMLDRSAAASDIRAALRAAAQANEHEVVRVISTWLGLADANGEAPSSREVGERLGVSHMTVQRALSAFGQHLKR